MFKNTRSLQKGKHYLEGMGSPVILKLAPGSIYIGEVTSVNIVPVNIQITEG